MATKKITLSRAIVGHSVIRELEFKDPTWRAIMEVGGEPYVLSPAPGGSTNLRVVPIYERVQGYAERLLVTGDGKAAVTDLMLLSIEDTVKVRDAILDFFLDADPRLERRPADDGSTTSPPNSDTTSAGETETSST